MVGSGVGSIWANPESKSQLPPSMSGCQSNVRSAGPERSNSRVSSGAGPKTVAISVMLKVPGTVTIGLPSNAADQHAC